MDATDDTEKKDMETLRTEEFLEAAIRYVKACIREPEQEAEKKKKKNILKRGLTLPNDGVY